MSTVPATTKTSSFSCHCLNVLVQVSGIDQLPPFPVEAGYLPVHVRDEGIQIAHDQFTSRTHGEVRQSEVPQRSVTLACLMCDHDVYRVWWDHRPPEDAPTSPRRVTTEGGILQSTSGWIEIKQTCLSGEAIQRLADSPEYSPLFRVVISRENPTPPASLSSGAPITAPPLSSATPPPPSQHLPDLPPLFLPPPFTPGHAAFVHLRGLATEQSLQLRHRAETELVAATKKKLVELDEAEQELKRQVLVLWRAFRNHVGEDDTKAQQQPADSTNVRSSANSTRVIRDFSPQPEGDVKWNPTPSKVNHSSALSQSMRTSAMHYTPKISSNVDDTTSGVAQSVPFEAPSKRWVTTEDTNVAASLHWSKMEENMRGEEEKRERGRKAKTEVKVLTPVKTPAKPESETSQATGTTEPKNKNTDVKQGSRKVQFDVKPTIASASERSPTDATKAPPLAPEESVFDIEFEDSEPTDASTEPVEQAPMPQATNGSSTPVNGRRKHKTNPLSFSSLRPSSLPAPSVLNAAFKPKQPLPPLNPASASPSSDINSQSQSRLASLPSGIRNHVPHQPLDDNEETQSTTIADGPSSVPSGSKNGRSWAIFTRNKGGKTTYPEDTVIAEEAEDELTSVTSKSVVDPEEDDSTTQFPSDPNSIDGVPRSMPIPTGIPGARAFEDPDYEAKTSLTDRPGHRVPKLHTAGLPSSVAIRKALYAQRDRQRGTDPGSFDDIGEEDEGNDSDQDDETLADGAPIERSRQKAFKILKAREELPAAGMWRSLAN